MKKIDKWKFKMWAFVFAAGSDVYRIIASIIDWRCHWRRLNKQPLFDVAYITNFENKLQQQFVGLRGGDKLFSLGLRNHLNGKIGRYLLINSISVGMKRGHRKEKAQKQFLAAVEYAYVSGARRILCAASTKRLFSSNEFSKLKTKYPSVIFTVGNNGTAWALLQDVFNAIKKNEIAKDDCILITGPTGFLGKTVYAVLRKAGFRNIEVAQASKKYSFEEIRNVRLVVACGHDKKIRLTKSVIEHIMNPKGIYVVDVCRPSAFPKNEFEYCLTSGVKVKRQDAGNLYNSNLKYVFPLGAWFVLFELKLVFSRIYGCFGEALSLCHLDNGEDVDLLTINRDAMRMVEKSFYMAGFVVSPLCNYGKKINGGGSPEKLWKKIPKPQFSEFAKGFASFL